MIYFNGLNNLLLNRIKASEHLITLYAPFLKKDIIKNICNSVPDGVSLQVIARWKPIDILMGASDLEVYEILKLRKFTLFINNRIHLKTYLIDERYLLTGSANLTEAALGDLGNSNHETLCEISNPSIGYLLFLKKILRASVPVTDDFFNEFKSKIDDLKIEKEKLQEILTKSEFLMGELGKDRDLFLISELPMSKEPEKLFEELKIILEKRGEVSPEAIHDIVLYDLESFNGENLDDFKRVLSNKFFNHPFILELCKFIDQDKRFGEIKEWVQKTCTNVPVPSRRDLTGNVQVLYSWLVKLGKDKFSYSRPGHSEILTPKKVKK